MADEKKHTQKAVAIVYDNKNTGAPKVLASGKGLIADKIIETAREAGVHVHEDENLVELLAKVPIGDEIPVELYQTVAEVLSFVYRVNERYKDKLQSASAGGQ
ncbi:EscU/YscU/HrcU family type III secretion system export apparatus switch protein [Desulfopila sp. IMCC35008]|uniref:EscU/YscU/HrcU family type III secretion system export apparatus switch protein n=1 Tax=Desulfopila sp. IMCC35008 TaxID=2653858 RepID=UPI0013D0F5D7|nr:EscU/YscU/HrcU family type III secretion system export apparatus switch protein [Desulfopila sp. IMCC35008]